MPSKSSNLKLQAFFGNLGYRLKLLEETRAQTDVFLSSRFNIFSFIEPDENRLSDIIAALLNPKGAHGQGDKFLREFLKCVCGRTLPKVGSVAVQREDFTTFIKSDRRRMDILVEMEDLAVAIENKPWAREQEDQVRDYIRHLHSRYGDRFIIVYLSATGCEPTSLQEKQKQELKAAGRLVCAAYNGHLRDWLELCVKESSSDKIRWFLRDFINFIEGEFSTVPVRL
ncbi:MAG TPA: PD-(D/E)XK nuclease family protein [Methylomirabilota bacterium]|nr:PD-(D/E)XK nuclease family protein [Methylomirabilota bacterium]